MWRLGTLLLFGLPLVGCAGSAKPTVVVQGTIRVAGKPLTVGMVRLFALDEETARPSLRAPIDTQGRYNLGEVPVGKYRVIIERGEEAPTTSYPFDRMYMSSLMSPLQMEVTDTTVPDAYDLQLKPAARGS
jgi:hypothetical protein